MVTKRPADQTAPRHAYHPESAALHRLPLVSVREGVADAGAE
jgi:hypothetical protein